MQVLGSMVAVQCGDKNRNNIDNDGNQNGHSVKSISETLLMMFQ